MIVGAGTLGQPDGGVGKPVVLDFVERRLARGLRERAVERRLSLQRQPRFELRQMGGREAVEAVVFDRLDEDRLAFVDVDA